MHHALAPRRVVRQELPVGEQSPHDVLRQLGPVHPDDGLARRPVGPRADLLPQGGQPLGDILLLRPLAQEPGVRPEPVHADSGVARAADDRGAARGERVRPAAGEEPQLVGAQHALQQLPCDVVRQHPEVLRRRPRRVREVRDPYVGPQGAQHPRHQGQVVVLHQYRRALGGLVGERLGERAVVALVRRPLRPELRVEDRFQRCLVQHVVDEPQRGVRDAVVGGGVHLGRNVQHPDTLSSGVARIERTTRPPYGLPVTVAERGTHPHRIRIGPDGRQPGHQPAPAPLGGQRPALRQGVRDGSAIGRHKNLGTRRGRTALGSHVATVTRCTSAQTYGTRLRRVPPPAVRRDGGAGGAKAARHPAPGGDQSSLVPMLWAKFCHFSTANRLLSESGTLGCVT